MSNRLFCSRSRTILAGVLGILILLTVAGQPAAAGDAPSWMHAVANAPLPAHDEKTEAVLLYSEQIVTVQSADKVKTLVRNAYKILRPGGREYGTVVIPFNQAQKVNGLRGWCIPAQGKDYEVKDKDAAEVSLPKIDGSELVSDVKSKLLVVPAADPGNIVGYEYEVEEQPYALQDVWYFQASVPIREAYYKLQLPPGWEYKTTWLNASEIKPTQIGGILQWGVSDVKAITSEDDMPPWRSVAGQMIVSYFPSSGAAGKSFNDWRQMGNWYAQLTDGRFDSSPEMKQKVAALTSGATTTLGKIQAIANFLQRDIRYVAIELGIGGWQPHPASSVFSLHYGDCKDKATLMKAMLREIGIDSFYVVINTHRGSVTPELQPYMGAFNHAILAIKVPSDVKSDSLYSLVDHPKWQRLLFFDPTNELTPLGQIGGYLQSNYGLLVTPDGGELVQLPKQPPDMNSIRRTGKLQLRPDGTLMGDFEEIRLGDRAEEQREALRSVSKDLDRVKPIERLLSHSFSQFEITKAGLINFQDTTKPFGYSYSVVAPGYAKPMGNLLLVRPRILGSKSSGLLETKEPRKFAVVFEGPAKDTDTFEINLPAGYEVDELPPPVNADYSFASYHSKTEFSGGTLRYTRSYEVKELSVPLSKVEELKKFYRIIYSDERSTAVLKPTGK